MSIFDEIEAEELRQRVTELEDRLHTMGNEHQKDLGKAVLPLMDENRKLKDLLRRALVRVELIATPMEMPPSPAFRAQTHALWVEMMELLNG